jgi:hypothetical protein
LILYLASMACVDFGRKSSRNPFLGLPPIGQSWAALDPPLYDPGRIVTEELSGRRDQAASRHFEHD